LHLIYFPAWMIGRYPKMKIMQVSHNAELASRFGSKVRNLNGYARVTKQSLVMLNFVRTPKQRDVGKLIMVVNILLLVLEGLLQDVVQIY